jgi:hypothetical protein
MPKNWIYTGLLILYLILISTNTAILGIITDRSIPFVTYVVMSALMQAYGIIVFIIIEKDKHNYNNTRKKKYLYDYHKTIIRCAQIIIPSSIAFTVAGFLI